MKPALFLATVLLLLNARASAAAVVFTDGPVFTNGRILVISGTLAGLERNDAGVHADATGIASVVCRDRDGRIVRRNAVPALIVFDETISRDMIAGGHAAFFLTGGTPTLDSRTASCGPGLTSTIERISFRTATITITQGGAVVLKQEFRPSS